jgi:cobalt-zinc-cadmium resistance protein CzcA
MAYENGEIDVFMYLLSLENATNIELDYLDNLKTYNRQF